MQIATTAINKKVFYFDLQYGEEYDSDRPMSVVREHQLFTDTHL